MAEAVDIFQVLKDLNIPFELQEHKAIFSEEDSKDVVNTILSGRTVILNIEGLDIGIAQRIIDFTSGASFSIGGTLQKVSNYIFVVTPDSVDVSGDLAGIMDAFDFSGVQTGFN